MKKIFSLFVFLCCLFMASTVFGQEEPNKRCLDCVMIPNPFPHPIIPIRPPEVIVQGPLEQIQLQSANIEVEVIGNIATTTYDLTYYNPNHKLLEGEFVLPLTESQTLAALALDINGKMRDGVVVEKQKARQTFEAVVRRGVDPALAEKVSGNQFKLRIYPFNAQGTRKVRVTVEEPLALHNGEYLYMLPLNYEQQLKEFSISINAPNVTKIDTELQGLHLDKGDNGYSGKLVTKDIKPTGSLALAIAKPKDVQVFTHTEDGDTYFYTDIENAVKPRDKKLPKRLAVFWDRSLSGSKRDLKAERNLLLAYLEKLDNAEVEVVTFNIRADKPQRFTVKNGDGGPLVKMLSELVYDGATRLDVLPEVEADEILIFSDGVVTFGKGRFKATEIPTYLISTSSEFEKLKGTTFINLSAISEKDAIQRMLKEPLKIVSYEGSVSEVYPAVGSAVYESVPVVGLVNSKEETLKINFGYSKDEIIFSKSLVVKAAEANPAVERLWAEGKIRDLEEDKVANKAEITRLGQMYSIVTDGTSLLVLDNVSDYVQYGIRPPDDLLEEYNRYQATKRSETEAEQKTALEESVAQAQIVKDWWSKDFEQTPPPKKYSKLGQKIANAIGLGGNSDEELVEDGAAAAGEARMEERRAPGRVFGMAKTVSSDDFMYNDTVANRIVVAEEAIDGEVPLAKNDSAPRAASIKLQAWDPDTPYLRILKQSSDAELYKDYLKLKLGYSDQPSFYFDVTDEFMRRNLKDDALVVLSNIVEMKLDNVELLRIAANKLLQMGYTQYAVELSQQILELRGEDPQPYRDLAQAYEANGDKQKALEYYYKVLTEKWARFTPIKQTVFVELNRLIAMNPDLDTSAIDKRLVFDMPVDIRIVLSWSSDNTDIDLHVNDPYDNHCYYSNKLTPVGGRYTADFTDGFGPEEFMQKKALKGKYVIKTNNFADRRQSVSGPSTLYLDLFTNYGRKGETHQRILVRAGDVKKDTPIGEIEFN